MTNKDSLPAWQEVILDRIDYHRLHQHNAKVLDDWDSGGR